MMESRTGPIRLFVPTGAYPPDIGGPATYVPLLEKYLPSHGFSVDVLPFNTVRHFPKGISHAMFFWNAFKKAGDADVVYAQDAVSVGWPALVAALLTRKPFVVKIVGDHVWEQGRVRFGVKQELDNFPFWPRHPYLIFLRLLQQVVVRNARKIIVPGIYLKEMVSRWGISEEKIAVIYNGIEIPVPIRARTEHLNRPLIVSVGRLTSWKGFYGVIDAVKREAGWHLVIVGDGPLRANLEAYVRQQSLSSRIHFTGLLSREDMHGWLKAADVFVLNSTYEGLPHVLIEAMSLGTSVVATDIAGNREVMTHEKEGLLVPVNDSTALQEVIKRTLEDSDTKTRNNRAQERARVFAIEKTVDGLAKLLKTVCAS